MHGWLEDCLERECSLLRGKQLPSFPEQECASVNQLVCCLQQWGRCSKTCAPLVSTIKHCQSHAINGTEASHSVWNEDTKVCFCLWEVGMFQQKHKKMNILDAMYLWHRNPLRLQKSRTALHNMALPLISVNVDKDDKICEWVEMQGHNHCPSPISEFIYVEKSVHTTSGEQPTVNSRQVWTDQAPALLTWQARKRNPATSLLTLSWRRSNGNTGAEDSKNLGNPDDRFVKAMDELQDFVSQVCYNFLKQRSINSSFKKQWTKI